MAVKKQRESYMNVGTPDTPPDYPGEGTRLPNGDWIGYRPTSKSGPPTIDINVDGIPFDKIKFL
jgi:hypothetical protein